MTIPSAIICRHVAMGLSSDDLRNDTGFELELFTNSLPKHERISQIPQDVPKGGEQ
jgi:hypothetical protein